MMSSDAWIMIAAGFGSVAVAVGFHVLLCRDRIARLRHVEKQLITSQGSSRSRVLGVAIKQFHIDPSISIAANRYDQVVDRLRAMARRYARFARWNSVLALIPAVLVAISISQFRHAREVERAEAARRAQLREIADEELGLLRHVANEATGVMKYDGLSPVPAMIPGGHPVVVASAAQLEKRVAEFEARHPEPSRLEDERRVLALARATVAIATGRYHLGLLAVGTTTEWGAPYASQVDLLRSVVFHGLDQPDLALHELERSVHVNDETGSRRLAGARLRAMDVDAAASAYRTLLERNLAGGGASTRALAELYNNRAVAQLLVGEYVDAQRDVERAMELELIDRPRDPGKPVSDSESVDRLVLRAAMLENRAAALRQLGKWSAALADLEAAVAVYDAIHARVAHLPQVIVGVQRFAAAIARADLLRELGRYDEALQDLADISTGLDALAQRHAELLEIGLRRVVAARVKARTLADLGRFDEAGVECERAVEQSRQLHQQGKSGRTALLLSRCLGGRGRILEQLEDSSGALKDYGEAIDLLAQLEAEGWTHVAVPLAEWLVRRSDLHRQLRQRTAALEDLTRATAILERLAAGERVHFQRQLAASLARRGDLQREGELTKALADYDHSIAIYRRLSAGSHDAALRRELAEGLNNRGVVLTRLGQFSDAVNAYSESITLYGELSRQDAASRFVESLATSLHNRAVAYRHDDRLQLAVFDYNEAIELRERLWSEGRPGAARELGSSLNNRAICLRRMRLTSQALADHHRAVEILNALVESDGTLLAARKDLGTYVANRGNALYASGEYEPALKDLERAVALQSELLAADRESSATLVASLNNLAWVRATCPNETIRNAAAAVEHATRACELTNWRDPRMLATLAVASQAAGDLDAAVKWKNQALALAPDDMKDELRDLLK